MDTLLILIAVTVTLAVLANLAASFGADSRDGFRLPDTRRFS